MNDDNIEKIKEDFYILHHIMAEYGWTDVVLTHLSVRINEDLFLISPFSLLFEDVKVEDLVVINLRGEIKNSVKYTVNPAGFLIHSTIYESRQDVGCVIHTHTDHGVAISCLREELLLADQMSFMFHQQIGYHDFNGIATDKSEKESLVKDLGEKKCLILRNHGLLVTGSSIAEAFWNYFYLEKACRIHLSLLPRMQEISIVEDKIKQKTYEQHKKFNHSGGLVPGVPGNPELAFLALKKKFIQERKR